MNWQEWFEKAWEEREEIHYRRLFGDLGAGIYCVPIAVYANVFKQACDPRWLHSGVFESKPGEKHDTWAYVTSGLSNAWDAEMPDADGYSGIGCEFYIELEEESKWIIPILHRMIAFQTLLAAGKFPGKGLLNFGDRIPLRQPMKPDSQTKLTTLLLVQNSRYKNEIKIGTGKFDLMMFVGISDHEAEFARSHSSKELGELLIQKTRFPITQLNRAEVV
jgi:Suppressor of fused protein (SUFU)